MTTFAVGPAGDGPFPVAVVFTECVGYREQGKENARRFASDGYYCVAPDLYYRVGKKFSFDMSGMATGGLKGPEAERMMKAATSVTPENGLRHRGRPVCRRPRPRRELGTEGLRPVCLGARGPLRRALAFPDGLEVTDGGPPRPRSGPCGSAT